MFSQEEKGNRGDNSKMIAAEALLSMNLELFPLYTALLELYNITELSGGQLNKHFYEHIFKMRHQEQFIQQR